MQPSSPKVGSGKFSEQLEQLPSEDRAPLTVAIVTNRWLLPVCGQARSGSIAFTLGLTSPVTLFCTLIITCPYTHGTFNRKSPHQHIVATQAEIPAFSILLTSTTMLPRTRVIFVGCSTSQFCSPQTTHLTDNVKAETVSEIIQCNFERFQLLQWGAFYTNHLENAAKRLVSSKHSQTLGG